ncbi:MAG: hypothetical protein KDA96_27440, partial [Planctomycetaceae bacterium]|nr:hypothetical protein [Planctomycetaceae bacterium]
GRQEQGERHQPHQSRQLVVGHLWTKSGPQEQVGLPLPHQSQQPEARHSTRSGLRERAAHRLHLPPHQNQHLGDHRWTGFVLRVPQAVLLLLLLLHQRRPPHLPPPHRLPPELPFPLPVSPWWT